MGRGPNSGGGEKARALRRAKRDAERAAAAAADPTKRDGRDRKGGPRGRGGDKTRAPQVQVQVDDAAVAAMVEALGGVTQEQDPAEPESQSMASGGGPHGGLRESSAAGACGIEAVGIPILPFQLLDETARALAMYGVDVRTATRASDRWGPGLVPCFAGLFAEHGLMTRRDPEDTDGGDEEEACELRADEAEALEAMYEQAFQVLDRGEFWKLDTGLSLPGTREIAPSWTLPLCELFLQNKCNRGDKCKFSHDQAQLAAHLAEESARKAEETKAPANPIYARLLDAERQKEQDNACVLEVRFPAGSRYPLEPPVILFRCNALENAVQLRVTCGLMEEAQKLAHDGEPCVYNLLLWLESGGLEELVNKGPLTFTGGDKAKEPPEVAEPAPRSVSLADSSHRRDTQQEHSDPAILSDDTVLEQTSERNDSVTLTKTAEVPVEPDKSMKVEITLSQTSTNEDGVVCDLDIGATVEVHGLVKAPQFNGQIGTVLGYVAEIGRYQVNLLTMDETLMCRPENLRESAKAGALPMDGPADTFGSEDILPAYQSARRVAPQKHNEAWARVESIRMQQSLLSSQKNATVAAIRKKREVLPSFGFRETILETLETAQALVICGATGCGKTTQVPQFILDHWIGRGEGSKCSLICTQPRRISAISVADRVAAERGEEVGGTVGYQIRLENATSQKTRLLFCTTGILLRKLEHDKTLEEFTHVLVDEVHERSVESDFLLMVLRDVMAMRPSLRVLMMSATVNADLFSQYFGGPEKCPVITIPGRAFPVESLFLEHAIERTQFRLDKGGIARKKSKMPKEELEQIRSEFSQHTAEQIAVMDMEKVNKQLITVLLAWICAPEQQRDNPGAVLVFLPGLADITAVLSEIEEHPAFDCETDLHTHTQRDDEKLAPRKARVRVVPLHSSLTSEHQRSVFSRPPKGTIKIVLATNIAETSVTIDDIVWVIDSGKMKETQYDPGSKMAALVETWVSKANAVQRRGRAGRIQPGCCFHLVTRRKFETLQPNQLPEIQRVPLEQLCLHIKVLPGLAALAAAPRPMPGAAKKKASPYVGVMAVLARVIEPPKMKAVLSAKNTLTEMNAFTELEDLTPLGHHLARLPVDCRLGKLLVLGAIFGCMDSVCTLAACLESHTPFVSPLEKRDEADAMKRAWACEASDHLTLLSVYNAWSRLSGSQSKQFKFCRDNFLSQSTLRGIRDSKLNFVALLSDAGFSASGITVKSIEAAARRHAKQSGDWTDGVRVVLGSELNRNESPKILKALLCAALFPNVATASGSGPPRVSTKKDGPVAFHPSSANASLLRPPTPYFVYLVKMKTAKVYLRDSTCVGLYPLLLFGDTLRQTGSTVALGQDNTEYDVGSASVASLIVELRSRLEDLLSEKVRTPSLKIFGNPVIAAIINLIESEQY